MTIQEKHIEDIIYNSPWLLDERYVIPSIRGKLVPGRQVNVGRNKNRYIDLLFKDTRDDRPVIIELKKGELRREDIAQTLEYRALMISADEEVKSEWENEFGRNYYCPKLILIGSSVTDEIKISANIAGIEVRTFEIDEGKLIDLESLEKIDRKLNEWNNFRKSGNRTLEDREDWVREIFEYVQEAVEECGINSVTTAKKLYETTKRDSYIIGTVHPFLNFKIDYNGDFIAGIYEYYNEYTYSEEYVYFDFLIQEIYNYENRDAEILHKLEDKAREILDSKGYNINGFSDGMATITIPRKMLNNAAEFKTKLIYLIKDAVLINNDITELYENGCSNI